MQPNYKDIWVKWMAFLEQDLEFRNEILNNLHQEVKKGFDVLVKISLEELEANIGNKSGIFSKIKPMVEEKLAFSVWSGYSLFLIEQGIDPINAKLSQR